MLEDKYAGAAFILGVCLIVAALVLSGTWRANKKLDQTINVVGSAKKEIVSDFGIFRCAVRGESPTPAASWQQLQAAKPKLFVYLQEQGIPADQVRPLPVTTYSVPEFNEQGRETGRTVKVVTTQRFEVQSADVKKVEQLALGVAALVEQGVLVEPETPEFHYSGLSELKVEVQALAAQDAMERARRIAAASGAKLGDIRSARMGVLQITPRHSNMVSDYGVNDLSSIEKEITAVVSASFALR